MKKTLFEKTIFAVSGILLASSAYMYLGLDRPEAELQAPTKHLFAKVKKTEKKVKENPFVIRNGSNAMPKGLGQADEKDKFMPKWQKDRLKDMNRAADDSPKPGTAPAPGISPAPAPAQTPPATTITPPADSGGGIAPATSGGNPAMP